MIAASLRPSTHGSPAISHSPRFEQELTANYTSLAEQFHFRSMEQETLKKA